jgi:hypothetical protein
VSPWSPVKVNKVAEDELCLIPASSWFLVMTYSSILKTIHVVVSQTELFIIAGVRTSNPIHYLVMVYLSSLSASQMGHAVA